LVASEHFRESLESLILTIGLLESISTSIALYYDKGKTH